MKSRRIILIGLTFMVVLVIAVPGTIYWQQLRVRAALHAYTLSVEVEKYLLECRRQEKNFILRNDIAAIRLHLTACDSAGSILSRLIQMDLPDDLRSRVGSLRGTQQKYAEAFKMMTMNRQNPSGGSAFIPAMHMCTEIARKCHAQIADIIADMKQRYQLVGKEIGMISLLLLIGAPIVSISTAIFLVRQVAAP